MCKYYTDASGQFTRVASFTHSEILNVSSSLFCKPVKIRKKKFWATKVLFLFYFIRPTKMYFIQWRLLVYLHSFTSCYVTVTVLCIHIYSWSLTENTLQWQYVWRFCEGFITKSQHWRPVPRTVWKVVRLITISNSDQQCHHCQYRRFTCFQF